MFENITEFIDSYQADLKTAEGSITEIIGSSIIAKIPKAKIDDICYIEINKQNKILAKVLGFRGSEIILVPFSNTTGLYPGAKIVNSGNSLKVPIGDEMLGSVVNALGESLTGKIQSSNLLSVNAPPPNALNRNTKYKCMETGIAGIDLLCPLATGQRIGLFASAGIGKSTLLGMLARNSSADINVIALVGERGREVKEFIDEVLGPEGLKKSVVVVATSDESSILRMTAPYTATCIAEYFRSIGKNVLLLVDSLTRTARAIREISISAGELPVRQGYTNSVYTELPKLIERAGSDQHGSITAIYTVLTSSIDELDPLSDEIKSLLDGHICLSSEIYNQGIRPAIDYTKSISRLADKIRTKEELEISKNILKIIYKLKKERDILLFGGKADEELSRALELEPKLLKFLNQDSFEKKCYHSEFKYIETIITS